MEEKDLNKLDPYLQEVLDSQVTLDSEEKKVYNKLLYQVLKMNLIPKMKQVDAVFKELFRKEMYTGSYYENLRVGTPNEFDLNLVLKLPAESFSLHQSQPGFLRIKTTNWGQKADLQKVQSWRDSAGYILHDRVLNWMESVVDKALADLQIPGCEIKRSMHGPAVTILITFGRQQSFSVDLVPVFVFGREMWPKPPVHPPPSYYHQDDWCVVPKAPINSSDKRNWRMSFHAQEKNILNNSYNMKPVLKLIKLLRDKDGWHNPASYYIKTVFMWEISSQPSLSTKGLGIVFMHMLEELKKCMWNHKIPFYWDKRGNLISGVSTSECTNIGNRIEVLQKTIMRKVNDEPEWVKSLFMPKHNEVLPWQYFPSERIQYQRQS